MPEFLFNQSLIVAAWCAVGFLTILLFVVAAAPQPKAMADHPPYKIVQAPLTCYQWGQLDGFPELHCLEPRNYPGQY
jgi:hypothetical protein